MKACNRCVVRVSALCLAALAVAFFATAAQAQPETPASGPGATTQPTSVAATEPAQPISAGEVPPSDSFKAMAKSGDDGSAMVIEWARPKNELPDATYVVEIAKHPGDFAKTDAFKHKDVLVLPAKLGDLYQTEISPSSDQFFPLPEPPDLTPDRLKQLLAENVLTAEECDRAVKILQAIPTGKVAKPDMAWAEKLQECVNNRDWLKTFVPPQGNLLTNEELTQALAALMSQFRKEKTDQAKAEQAWLDLLMAFLKKKDLDLDKDKKLAINTSSWYFRLAVQKGDQKVYVGENGQPKVVSAAGKSHWFKWGQLNNLIFALVFCIIVGVFIQVAKRRPNLFIRKIGGLEAVDEAIGRSTEMDKPVFFVHGLGGVGGLATMAAINILGRVATRAAEHDSRVKVMNSDPIVTAVSQEVVQQSYMQAGRPDAFNPDDVSMVASDQFSYVAAVSGRMVREQPGAIFLLGSFAAESLLLAETGASTGAIQVAGTDSYTQLPFFITTCDYTLIGEELYAASAYLSREPKLLGSLRGQDVGKAFLMIVIVIVSVLLTIAVAIGANWDWLRKIFVASMD